MTHNLQVSYTALGMSDDNQTCSYSMPSMAASSPSHRQQRNVNFNDDGLNDLAGSYGYPPQQLPATTAVRRFSKSIFQRPRSMSVWSDISRSSMRLDESHKVNISKVYALFFGNIWLFYIIIMYLIFSIIEALLVKISHYWENLEHRGISTMWRGRHSCSLRQIVITMSVFGLVFSTFFAAKLSALMTKPPEYSDIESFMDLRAREMPVYFPQNSQRIIETFLGANHFAALLPNARFIPLKNWSDLALSFNSSNAYQVTATSWAAINSYQMFFNRPLVQWQCSKSIGG
ncbi:uncharacterized protein Dwil_GK18011 [Drosophila willistoni]|uniref:Uncharacterized protein n=1 Tax=Drosophila willistoni TaxID=7260 RepID=B4N671_DROWI|nr:uncharacterized protein Dwil_GK18011 [Drosophila willistoni]